jgi:hypothetical protein
MPLSTIFQFIVAVSFIGGEKQSTTSFYVNSIVSQLGKASICISALILDKLYIPGQNFPEINWYNQSYFILKCNIIVFGLKGFEK